MADQRLSTVKPVSAFAPGERLGIVQFFMDNLMVSIQPTPTPGVLRLVFGPPGPGIQRVVRVCFKPEDSVGHPKTIYVDGNPVWSTSEEDDLEDADDDF